MSSRIVSFALVVSSLAGCAASADPPSSTADATSPDAPGAVPQGTCTAPKTGRYLIDVTPKNDCPWWDSTRDSADMNVLEEAVRYPHSDDLCGDVRWKGCTLEDECGPLKFSAGSQGWYGKGSLSITFTDDEHFSGSVTYDIGAECVMILEVTGRRLNL